MVSTTAILTLAVAFFGLVKASPINLGPDVEVELDKRQSKPTFFIKSKTITGTCLGTTSTPANGVPLYHIPCTDPNNKFNGAWEIAPGNNQGVKLAGTNFCLDAGSNPYNGGPAKLWTCLTVPQQTWYLTNDQHIAITNGNQCLSSNGQGCGNGGCAPGTSNCGNDQAQVWDVVPTSGGGGGGGGNPPSSGVGIHFNGDNSRCIRPGTRAAGDGAQLYMGNCLGANDPFASLQYYDIQRGSTKVKLTGSNLCLGVPPNVKNGDLARLYTCADTGNQRFYYTGPGDDHIALEGGSVCLDVKREDGNTLQFWQCSSNNQQKFTL